MITPDSFLAPRGEIEPSFFTDENVAERLEAYLIEAKERAASVPASSSDYAIRAYVYYRAFRAVYLRLSSDPSQVALTDQGSRTYTPDQVSRFRTISEEYYKMFASYLPAASTPAKPETSTPSQRVPNVPTW